MYKEKFINFLKKVELYDEDILEYIEGRTIHIDYDKDHALEFYGCYPLIKDNIVKDIRLCVPTIKDDITVAINIHEYIHLIKVFNYLNKEYVFDQTEELLPVIFEFLYFRQEEKNNKKLQHYVEFYKSYIRENGEESLKMFIDIYDNKKEKPKRLIR